MAAQPKPPPSPAITQSAASQIATRFFQEFRHSDIPRSIALIRNQHGALVWHFKKTNPDGSPYLNRGGNISLEIDAGSGAITRFWFERR